VIPPGHQEWIAGRCWPLKALGPRSGTKVIIRPGVCPMSIQFSPSYQGGGVAVVC